MSDAFKKQSLQTDFGQRVNVDRETEASPEAREAAMRLLDIGLSLLHPMPENQDALEYLGACAVHIYKSPKLDQLMFVTQHPLGNVSEPLAEKALEALRSDTMVAYGRKRQKKRSGW